MPQPLYTFSWWNVQVTRYKNNDLYGGDKPSMGKKRNKKGTKKVVQESQPPEDTPLGNDAKQRRIPTLVMWYLPVTDRLRRIFLTLKKPHSWHGGMMSARWMMIRLHTRLIVVSGKGSMRSIKNSAMTQGMYDLAWAPMEWIPSMRGWATTALGQWSWPCTTSQRGCVRRESAYSSVFLFLALNNQALI